MAKANAPFYSMKFNRIETVNSHKTKEAAKKKAGDFGMIYETLNDKESQVHVMSNNTLQSFSAGSRSHAKMDKSFKDYLLDLELLSPCSGRIS
ncbi:hypothetical protein [Pseudoalteromonas marina]|uniref:Uncharacterized protein n=1 Tax=Pseudoalteromonas marina TaxID=267375 RepID=A0ABT9FIS9_9GAMM|nr:hypothetical protein [Pseudoalteromonas marina]MDP2566391.1 hypothetical protein [Pseudoalteromonas marina]